MALSIVQQQGRLRIQGSQIVNQKGKPVTLRGMSLFWSQWIGQYYNRDAVQWLQKDWGCTVVRAALAVGSGGYLEHPEQEKQKIIAVVDAAIASGIYVIIDWHDHNADQHVTEAKAFFGEMAKRYAKHANVIYETFNEPLNKQDWSKTLKPYHEAVIAEIRRYDKQNLIICGTAIGPKRWTMRPKTLSKPPMSPTRSTSTQERTNNGFGTAPRAPSKVVSPFS